MNFFSLPHDFFLLSGAFASEEKKALISYLLVLPACFLFLDLVSFGAARSYCDPLTFFLIRSKRLLYSFFFWSEQTTMSFHRVK